MDENKNKSYGEIDSSEMVNEESSYTEDNKKKMISISVVVLLIAAVGYFAFSSGYLNMDGTDDIVVDDKIVEDNTSDQTDTTAPEVEEDYMQEPSSIEDRSLPWAELSGQTEATVGENVELTVSASSAGKDVAGYDMLIVVDTDKFDIVNVTSDLSDFSLRFFDRKRYVSITAFKDINAKTPTILDDTKILSVVLKPKMTGSYELGVSPSVGNEVTQFVDTSVSVIKPQTSSLMLNVN